MARALGAVGNVEAVEPLLALKSTAGREAARHIQERLGDAEGGRLSLVEHSEKEGGLSVVPGPGNRVRGKG